MESAELACQQLIYSTMPFRADHIRMVSPKVAETWLGDLIITDLPSSVFFSPMS